jgi:hypothetical protein
MKGILRTGFVLALAGLVTVLALSDRVFSMAGPCERLGALETRIDNMEEELETLTNEMEEYIDSGSERLGEITRWFNERLAEFEGAIVETMVAYAYYQLMGRLDLAEEEAAERLEAATNQEERDAARAELDRLASIREEADELKDEADQIQAEMSRRSIERNELRVGLEEERSRRTGLMAECGLISEMEDPMGSSAQVDPVPDEGPVRPGPISPASRQPSTDLAKVRSENNEIRNPLGAKNHGRLFRERPLRIRTPNNDASPVIESQTMQVQTGPQMTGQIMRVQKGGNGNNRGNRSIKADLTRGR